MNDDFVRMVYVNRSPNICLLRKTSFRLENLNSQSRSAKQLIIQPPRLPILFIYPINLSNCLSVCLWLYSPLFGLGHFFSFLIFFTVGTIPWTGDQPVTRPLPAHTTTQTQNKCTQTSMSQVRFEPTILVFELTKAVHVLDQRATVIGYSYAHISVFLVMFLECFPHYAL
jgi:hypothetical protein